MSKIEVIDCKIETYSTKLFSVITMRRAITLILSDNKETKIDYILTTYDTLENLKECYREELITLLNKIYTEHNKLLMLGLNYPKYEILKHRQRGLTCALIGFGDPYRIIKSYKLTNYTNEVYLDIDSCNVDEIILAKPTYLNMISGNLKITGIEYVKKLTDTNIGAINSNVQKWENKTLILKHLEYVDMLYKKVSGIERIVLEDTCTLKDIPIWLFINIDTLKEIKVCKNLETIDAQPLWSWLEGSSGNIEADNYY